MQEFGEHLCSLLGIQLNDESTWTDKKVDSLMEPVPLLPFEFHFNDLYLGINRVGITTDKSSMLRRMSFLAKEMPCFIFYVSEDEAIGGVQWINEDASFVNNKPQNMGKKIAQFIKENDEEPKSLVEKFEAKMTRIHTISKWDLPDGFQTFPSGQVADIVAKVYERIVQKDHSNV